MYMTKCFTHAIPILPITNMKVSEDMVFYVSSYKIVQKFPINE